MTSLIVNGLFGMVLAIAFRVLGHDILSEPKSFLVFIAIIVAAALRDNLSHTFNN